MTFFGADDTISFALFLSEEEMYENGQKLRIISNVGIYSNGRPICGSLAVVKYLTARHVVVETINEKIKLELLPQEVCPPDHSWWGADTNPKQFVKDYINTEEKLRGSSSWKISEDGWAKCFG